MWIGDVKLYPTQINAVRGGVGQHILHTAVVVASELWCCGWTGRGVCGQQGKRSLVEDYREQKQAGYQEILHLFTTYQKI